MQMFKKIKNSSYFPFLLLFCIYMVIHLLCTINFGDDLVFSQIPQSEILSRLKWNYYNWSTRLIIEFVYYNLYHFPLIIWRILDSLIMVLIAYSIMKLFSAKISKKTSYLICALVLLYPFIQMSSAGWIATTANYTWPLAFGLYGMTYLRRIYDNTSIHWWQHILFCLSFVYAGNSEQIVCLLLVVYAVFIIYFLKKHNFHFPMLFHFSILVFLFLFKVTGPSNALVNLAIAKTYYPNYYSQSLVSRITDTFISTCGHFIKYANPILLLILCILCYLVYVKHKNWHYRMIPTLPLILCLGIAIFSNAEFSQFYAFSTFDNGFINVFNFNHFAEYVPLITYLFILLSIMLSIYLIWGTSAKTIVAELIFVGGFATRMILTFSASIYASALRTFNALYFCLIALLFLLFQESETSLASGGLSGDKLNISCKIIYKILYASVFILALFSCYNTLLTL